MHKTELGHVAPSGGSSFPTTEASPAPHIDRYLALGLGYHQILTYAAACLAVLIFIVIVPAVWSTSETRRTAAQNVLDKLLRFMRPHH